ncbi:MAG: hypothetical protein KF802_03585 [Bdellovibrionaceae bacterium]|nr:hypothetical protein [Pseudobdellovibrionaceae bacterium]MBX3033296.1 hypothetical protein [Pseudobdellovibrionaceae bacterium]
MKKLFLLAALPLCLAFSAHAVEEQDMNPMSAPNMEEQATPDNVQDSYYYYRGGRWGYGGYRGGYRGYCRVRCYGGYYGRTCRRACYRPGWGWYNADAQQQPAAVMDVQER